MEFRILGPLEVRQGDRVLRLGTGKQRALLALLLLHRNEPLPTERLVDELWGESPPETAAKIVQNYVSLLRRALVEQDGDRGGTVILTHGHGYLLSLETEELDLDRFEELLGQGREALAQGRPEAAAPLLRDALLLWRGPPLADVAYEEFAQTEVARLEERRLVALECRVEADLALGRHVDLVGELEALVARHPFRERLRGQLMLALYRSGRQAEALEVYRDGRRTLVAELGIEPSQFLRDLEQGILRQDPSLRPPPVAGSSRGRRRLRRRSLLALALLASVVVLVGASILVLSDSGEPTAAGAVVVRPNSVAVVDPRTDAVVASIPVGSGPGPIAVGEGSVWVANVGEQTLTRIDVGTRTKVATIGLGVEPTGLAVGDGAVWVAGGFDRALLRVDTADNRVRLRLRIREVIGPLPAGYELGPSGVAVTEGTVWLAHGEEVSRIDPRTGRVLATVPAGGSWTAAIAAGEGGVWVAENEQATVRAERGEAATGVARIDPDSSVVTARIPLPGLKAPMTAGTLPTGALATGEDALWAAAPAENLLWRIDAGAPHALRSLEAGKTPASVASGEGGIWVENHAEQTIVRVDPFSNTVLATVQIDSPTRGIAAGEGFVWVSVAG